MFEKLKTRIQRNAKIRRTVNELNSMSNRDLADIGISRYDIEKIAREAVTN